MEPLAKTGFVDLVRKPVLDDVTVVIPTIGRSILGTCLYRIASGNRWPAQIIVVNQGISSEIDCLVGQLRSSGLAIEHVRSTQRGKAAAVNRGIERATTRFVAVTDDDCFAEDNWLETMRRHLASHPDAVITGPAYPTGDEAPVSTVTVATPAVSRRPGLRFELFCGSNMGAARTAIDQVGVFDEDPCFVAAAEDCDWAFRALRAHVPIVYAPDVIVHHFGWRDTDERRDRYQQYARSHGSFYGKHLRRGDPLIALRLGLHVLRAARRWGLGTLRRDAEATRIGRAYLFGLIPGVLAGWKRGAAW